MVSIYTVFKCKRCRREFILITEEVIKAIKRNKFIACPYCGGRELNSRSINDLRKGWK